MKNSESPEKSNINPHLLYSWLDELVRNTKILDAVEEILGPNILVRASQFFAKPPNDPQFVSFHQDGTYWQLEGTDVVSAWVALTPSFLANGCLRVIPSSHLTSVSHKETYEEDNMLTRGQEINGKVDEKTVLNIELQAGEMSLHHLMIIHGSEPNRSEIPRIGYAIRYMKPSVKPLQPIYALLVRGEDEFGHFLPAKSPKISLDEDAIEMHKLSIQTLQQSIGAKFGGSSPTA